MVTVKRQKLPGKTEENDANRYMLHDSWLINAFPAPAGTPPQLVARYGHTVGGFDVDEWLAKHAPDFDRAAWQTAYDNRLAGQLAKEAEQRRKERSRRQPKKGTAPDQEQLPEGGDVKNDATPQDEASGGGSVKNDATGDVRNDATGGVTNDALLLQPVAPEPSFEMSTGGDGHRPSTGGFASAGAKSGAGDEDEPGSGGSAAVIEESAPEMTTGEPVRAGKPARKRAAPPATKTREPRPVTGDAEVFALLDSLGVLTSPANRIPPLRRAVREFLGAQVDARDTAFRLYPRTVEHAVTRINAGWHRAQGPARSAPGFLGCARCTETGCTGPQEHCDRIRKPQAYLAELLYSQDCERPDCERGVILGTDQECGVCNAQANARTADRQAEQWLAEESDRRARAAAKAAAERQAVIDAVYDEAAEENRRRDRIRAAKAAETEATARLREQLAAEHPELAAIAEVPEPRGAEGFVRAAGRGRAAAEEQRVRAQLVADGLVGTALDAALRRRMAAWKADRRQEAEAADLAARAAHPVGAWPTANRQQPADAPF
ncbi:hypothetical protein [Streptomyces sp. NPDC054952]